MNKPPEGWKPAKLGDVVKHIKDRNPDRSKWTFNRYISGEHIDNGEIRITKSASIEGNEEVIGPAFHMRFKPGQVLYVTRRAYLRKCGMAFEEGVCSNVAFTLETKSDKMLQTLLPFLMQTEAFVEHATNNSHGSTNPFLNWKDIASFEFYLPPMDEQKKINELLWDVENHIKSLELYKLEFDKFYRITLSRLIRLGTNHAKKNKNKFFEYNADWKLIQLKDITHRITKGTTPTTYGMKYVPEGINFIKVESIDEIGNFIPNEFAHIDEDTHQFLKRSIIQENDLLFTIAGALGRMAIATKDILPANTNQAVAIIRPDLAKVDVEYLRYVLSSKFINKIIDYYAVQTAQANISLGILSNLEIPLPDMKTQKEMVQYFKALKNASYEVNHNLKITKEMRNKLMNELLTGKLRLMEAIKNVQRS